MTTSTGLVIRFCVAIVCAVALAEQGSASMVQSTDTSDVVPMNAIRDSARQVMEHSDFRSVRRRVLEQIPVDDMDQGFLTGIIESIGTAIGGFFASLFPASAPRRPRPVTPSSGGNFWDNFDVTRALSILLVIVIAGIVIWLVARLVKHHQQDPGRGGIPLVGETALELATPPGEIAASTYETRALQYAQQGNFPAAIRELLLGSMSWIERAGLIRFRKGLTNRDYVRAVWRQEERRTAYLVTETEFELVYFGRRAATAEMFDRCLSAFQGAFREEAAITRDEG